MNVKQNLIPVAPQQFVRIQKDHTLVNAMSQDID